VEVEQAHLTLLKKQVLQIQAVVVVEMEKQALQPAQAVAV
jgi:hypothetical protein